VPMTRFRLERLIEAPPEAVYRLYTDSERLTEWQPGLRGTRALDGPPDDAGTTYILDQDGPELRIRVTRVESPRLHEQLESMRLYEWLATARFEPTATGATRFTFDAEFRARSRLGSIVLPLAGLAGRWFAKQEFDRFKQVAERDQRAAAGA
jgi:uncharacterized protein YndB with AHSA1/START domain